MTVNALGKITVATPGAPVALTTDSTIKAHKIVFSQVPGTTGKTYIKSKSTGTVIRAFLPCGASGYADEHTITADNQTNALRPADWAVDADNANEGLYVRWEIQ